MMIVLLLSCSYVIVQSLDVACTYLVTKNSPPQLKSREAYKKINLIFVLFFLFIVDITTINQQNTVFFLLMYMSSRKEHCAFFVECCE